MTGRVLGGGNLIPGSNDATEIHIARSPVDFERSFHAIWSAEVCSSVMCTRTVWSVYKHKVPNPGSQAKRQLRGEFVIMYWLVSCVPTLGGVVDEYGG